MNRPVSVPGTYEQTAERKGAKTSIVGENLISSLCNNKLGYAIKCFFISLLLHYKPSEIRSSVT